MLDVMNRPLIIYNLRNRYKNNEIYTNVGTILVSCNPYKKLPLYTPAVIDSYRRRGTCVENAILIRQQLAFYSSSCRTYAVSGTRQLDPHVFMIADDAYNNLMEHQRSQSIVIR